MRSGPSRPIASGSDSALHRGVHGRITLPGEPDRRSAPASMRSLHSVSRRNRSPWRTFALVVKVFQRFFVHSGLRRSEQERELFGDLHQRCRAFLCGNHTLQRECRSIAVSRVRTAAPQVGVASANVFAVHPRVFRINVAGDEIPARDVRFPERSSIVSAATVFGSPTEQQVVHNVREITGVAVLLDRDRAVPLRQLATDRE